MTTSSLAQVAKLVDAGDSKSPAARCVGSSPTLGTKIQEQPEAQSVSGCSLLCLPFLLARVFCSTFLRLFYILKGLQAFFRLIWQ